MPTSREKLIRHGYSAWDRDDFGDFSTLLHPEVEWHTSGMFPGLEPVYRGHDGVREWWLAFRDPFETFTIELQSLTERGDTVVTRVHFTAMGKESGVEVELPFANVFWLEGDLIVRFGSYQSLDEAFAAAER